MPVILTYDDYDDDVDDNKKDNENQMMMNALSGCGQRTCIFIDGERTCIMETRQDNLTVKAVII